MIQQIRKTKIVGHGNPRYALAVLLLLYVHLFLAIVNSLRTQNYVSSPFIYISMRLLKILDHATVRSVDHHKDY
jgi:hypothetical protein